MAPIEYQRARNPGQKEERRTHLLAVARELLAGGLDTQALSLNELARRAGMAKSNVYRYFESLEAVLLELLRQEWELWAEDLKPALAGKAAGGLSLEEIAQSFARITARRPLLGQLSSILPSIIERNLAVETIRDFKRASLVLMRELAKFLHQCRPSISEAAFEEFAHHAFTLMIGLWPISHPSALVAEALEAPEFAAFRHDFERDFARGLLLLLRGLSSEGTG
jgi:AcrR family transcriptional regulator